MVKLMISEKGDGKTKRLMEYANEVAQDAIGNLVFISSDGDHMFGLKHNIRFVSMKDFPVKTADEFIGFICGIISNDYDINYIFIDGFFKLSGTTTDDLKVFVERLEKIGKQFNVKFRVTASSESVPAGLNVEQF